MLKKFLTIFFSFLILAFTPASISNVAAAFNFENISTTANFSPLKEQRNHECLQFKVSTFGTHLNEAIGSSFSDQIKLNASKGGTEVVTRWMSQAELKATLETGLLRGGRQGTHYVTDAANATAQRARQRLALPQTPEVRVRLEVPSGRLSAPSRVQPAYNMPGGGLERTGTGGIPVKVLGWE